MNEKKIYWKPLLLCLAVPLAVGGLSALLTKNSMAEFEALNKPPLTPPGSVFPIVWSILFILMGIASYLVLTSDQPREAISAALKRYILQLVFNFFWPIFFFRFSLYLFSFFWLLLLWLLILTTFLLFFRISKTAGWLFLPYLLWTTFAAYLNFGVFLLN